FGIDELLSGQNANELYKNCNSKLQQSDFRVLGLLQQMEVQVVCTTDDPTDNLEHHSSFRETGNKLKLLPSFRPDKAFAVQSPEKYRAYLEVLGQASGRKIGSYADLLQTLQDRIEFFHSQGCRVADHGVEKLHRFQLGDFDIELLFTKLYEGSSLTPTELTYFAFETLVHLGRMYHKAGWVQQFHLGALRNTNQRMLSKLGPDTGFDSIGDFSQASALAGYFDLLDSTDQLTKTVIYNLNPADNEMFAAMIGNYNDGSVRAKMQFGSAWWFLDQKDGMEKQLNSLSNIGLLSCFIGMLTDSRSFLSFPRHEYFRRILCNLIGKDVENGELPADEKWLGKIVADVCYHNAKAYFDFF
ncbi:MAG: glucuronate isomerase, partial [Bacteroidota bacterium]